MNFLIINQQATQMDEISKVLLENKKLPSHIAGEEGIKDMRVLDAIYSAAATGKRVSLI
jgi:predicted dehydrogenase